MESEASQEAFQTLLPERFKSQPRLGRFQANPWFPAHVKSESVLIKHELYQEKRSEADHAKQGKVMLVASLAIFDIRLLETLLNTSHIYHSFFDRSLGSFTTTMQQKKAGVFGQPAKRISDRGGSKGCQRMSRASHICLYFSVRGTLAPFLNPDFMYILQDKQYQSFHNLPGVSVSSSFTSASINAR